MKKHYSMFAFAGGLVLLVIQLLALIFKFVNGDDFDTELIFAVAKDTSFEAFISEFWSGIIGSIMLIVLFVRRMSKGPEAMMTFVGVLLWVIQLLSRYESQTISSFILSYLIGITGVILVGIAALYDVYLTKGKSRDDEDMTK